MEFIKQEDYPKYVEQNGMKLFYTNLEPNGKLYKDHIEVLENLKEDFNQLQIYVITKEVTNEKDEKEEKEKDEKEKKKKKEFEFEFLFYQNNVLLQKFTNSYYIGDITNFIRTRLMSKEKDTSNDQNVMSVNSSVHINEQKTTTITTENEDKNKKEVINRIEKLLNLNKIILFMKGSKETPCCKFSNAVVHMLNEAKIKYETYNILEDEELRNELKIYSNWPTYPQLYISKELIGGHDIIKQLYETNQLNTVIPSDCYES